MKNMKGLKVSSTAMDTESIALHFFYEVAHGRACAFMVANLVRLFSTKNTKGLRKL